MFPWKYRTVHSADVLPRQFEYHPNYQDVILYGTQDSKVGILSTESGCVTPLGVFGKDMYDPILGLCWFRKENSKFVAGSSCGLLKYAEFSLGTDPRATPLTRSYPSFPHLSSVHINCEDTHLLVSGTSKDITIYDLKTGQKTLDMERIHTDSINISRFSNHSPNVLATCSFDTTVKLWDMRAPHQRGPMQCMKTDKPIVMINFSPSDAMILSAGSDNEVHQFVVASGEKDLTYDVPKRYSSVNFTRAYYSMSGKFVASGGSEEDCLNIMCSSTGALICNIPLFPGTHFPSPYVQSLRLCPINDKHITALVNDRVLAQRQIVHIEITSDHFADSLDVEPHSNLCRRNGDTNMQCPSYALASADRARSVDPLPATTTSMAETSIPETPQVYSLLPPSDSYLKSLDKLWFQCVNGSQRLATPEGKWRDGVVYLTFGCPGDVDRKLPLYSGSSWSIFCDCKGSADWMRQFSMCIPIQPVMLCPRNSLFSALIQTSISEATECAVGPEKVCGISCSGLGCNASVRSLAIRVESILHLSNLLEELIFFNCVLRYLYSTTLSVDVLIKLATSPPDKSVLFDESIDQVELSHGVAAIKNTKFDIEQFVDVIFIMYGIADQLNIIELQLHIDCIISTLLRVHTALKILVCASQYRRNQLILSSLRFIGGNFESIYANSKVLVYDRSTNVAKKGMLYNFLKAVEIKSPDMLDNASICIDVLPIPDNTCPHSSLLTPSVDWWCKMLTDICQLYEPSADLLAEVATSFGDISELNASITTENKEAHSEINLTMSASADIHSLYGDDSSISTNEENDEINDNEDIHDAINTISARNEEVLPFNVAVRTSHEYHRVAGVSLSAEDAIGGNSSKISDYALSIQIPFIFGHSSVLIFNEIVLHFGGRNNYTMFGNDMLLTYFPAKRKWKYVQTFGNMPPMLNTTLALPLQHSNTRHVLHIDDKYGKWSFSILDCHSMMWSSVHVDKSRVGSLFHRHRASISAVSTNESVGFGESTAVNHNQWSHLVVWGGYCFNTQRSKNDVWVVSFSARGGASISTRSSASSATGFTSSPSEEEDMRASLELDESVTDYQIADQDIMPLSGLKSTSSNIKLPQIGRLTDAMIAPEAVVVTSFQPLLTGRPPPTRWGSSSAVINIPDGIRMLVHGGVGQLEGMMEDEVYSLRCGNPTSMHWETVRVTGLGPGTRCGHTMTTSQSGRCILFYGGCVMSTSMWQFREAENDSIFCLEYVCSDYNSIDFTWSALRLSGITISPSLRMKHSAVMWHNAGTQQLIIFGGVQQSGGINGDKCISERGVRLYELSGREANGLSNFNQTIILITAANRLTRSKYIIHESYRELLRTGMLSDLNVQVQEKQRDKDDILQTFMLPVHSAVVGIRAQSLASSIGWARHSPATKECKPHDDSNNLFLDPDICGDIDIARCFLDYLYSGVPNLNPANVMQIAAIADLYVIENLYKHCECYLLHFLSEYNACGLLSCIEESFVYSKMKYLRVTAVSIIATNFQSLKDTSEYCNLPDRVKLEISKLRESNLKYIDI